MGGAFLIQMWSTMDKLEAAQILARVKARKGLEADPTSTLQAETHQTENDTDAPLNADSPVNQIMFREGRAWALETVLKLRQDDSHTIVARLMAATRGRPDSYASGIRSVAELMKLETSAPT